MYRHVNHKCEIEVLTVEQVAIYHYKEQENFINGIHCEGALMVTIFFTLFWDIIYSVDIPDVFISKLQYLPLDFYYDDFYENRKNTICTRLDEIKTEWSLDYMETYIVDTWDNVSTKKSLISPFIVNDGEELYQIILCIGRAVVSDICKRLAENFRRHNSGMPDLFVWNDSQVMKLKK